MKLIQESCERFRISWGSLLLWVGVAALMLVEPVVADVYYWKDDKGVIHFSNQEQPPPGATLYLVEPPPREPLPVEPEPEPEPLDQEREAVEPPESKPDASEIQEGLDETRRKLDDIEEKLNDVTGRVEQTLWATHYAAATALEARSAAMQAREESAHRYAAEWKTHKPGTVMVWPAGGVIPGAGAAGRRIGSGIRPEQEHFFNRPVEQGPRPTDFDVRFRQPTDFNERFRQPSAFERQFIQKP